MLENMYLSTERGLCKGEVIGKWVAEELHRPKNKIKRGERDYTDEALALLHHFKPLMNLWRALMSALDTEEAPTRAPQN